MNFEEWAKNIAKILMKAGLSKEEALDVLDDAKACVEEGVKLKKCKYCNALLDDDARYCTQCGKKQN
mgnify:CR=1 FL=1